MSSPYAITEVTNPTEIKHFSVLLEMIVQAQRMLQSAHVNVIFWQIPADPYCGEPAPAEGQEIDTMCMSPAEETLAISTNRGQLYSFSLSSVDMNKVKQSGILMHSKKLP